MAQSLDVGPLPEVHVQGEPMFLAPLYACARRQKENFCTASLAGLLKAGFAYARADMPAVLGDIFNIALEAADFGDHPEVRTQLPEPESGRRPDLTVLGTHVRLVLEAKAGAGEGRDQLKDYDADLSGHAEPKRKLAYLTGPFASASSHPVRHLRWEDAWRAARQHVSDPPPVMSFLIREFEMLLHRADLLLEHIGRAMESSDEDALRDMIKAAMGSCGFEKLDPRSSADYAGCFGWTAERQVWVGTVRRSDPRRVYFQFTINRPNDFEGRLRRGSLPVEMLPMVGVPAWYLALDDRFFSLVAGDQLREILAFLEKALPLVREP